MIQFWFLKVRRQGTTGEVLSALRDGRFALIYTTPILVEIIDALGRNPYCTKNHIEPEDIAALVNFIRLHGEPVIRFFKGELGDVYLILRLDPLSYNRRLAESGQSGDQRQRLALAAFK